MNGSPTLQKVIVGSLLCGGLGLAGLGIGAGNAQANRGPYTAQANPWTIRPVRIGLAINMIGI